MNIRTYLYKYHQDEINFFIWLKSHHVDCKEAVEIIYGYMMEKKDFVDSNQFSESVLKDTRQREIDKLLSPLDINLVLPKRRILWHLIINLLRRMVG